MTREEHKAMVQKMLAMVTPENQAGASEILTQLSEDYEKTLTESETLTKANETLTENNEKLRQVNSELFLKVGTTKKETHNEQQNNGNNGASEKEMPFEALFNEKGELI